MGVTCEQCWADDMAVNEQGYYQCDQCGYILHALVPESAELDDTPGGAGMQGRRTLVSQTTLRKRHLELNKSASQAAADLRAALGRPAALADDAADFRADELDLDSFRDLPDGCVNVASFFDAFQLILTWHVRALAAKLAVDPAPLADVVGQIWKRYLDTREQLIQYRRRSRLIVPQLVRREVRKLARIVGDPVANPRDAMFEEKIDYDDVKDRASALILRGRALEVANRPRMLLVLSLVWLGALHLRLAVLPSDLVRWCYDGTLPFLLADAKFAATQIDRGRLLCNKQGLSAFKIAHTAVMIIRQLDLPPATLNMPAIIAAAVSNLHLPRGVLTAYADLCARCAVPPVVVDKNTLLEQRNSFEKMTIELRVCAHLVVAVKARFGVGFGEKSRSERAPDFELIERWLTKPPRGVRMPPDFRALRFAAPTQLARLADVSLRNNVFNSQRTRREADQLLVPITTVVDHLKQGNRRRKRDRVDEDEDEEVDDDDGADDGDDRNDSTFVLTRKYRFWPLRSGDQAHEPLLDQLLACLAWFYNTKRTSVVRAVHDVETAMIFLEKQQQ